MDNSKLALYRYQRDWRRKIIYQLKQKLGLYCHGCSSADAWHLPTEFLELVIPDRTAPDLLKYGSNVVTIYRKILNGDLPSERVTLLCADCKYEHKYKGTTDGDRLEKSNSGAEG